MSYRMDRRAYAETYGPTVEIGFGWQIPHW